MQLFDVHSHILPGFDDGAKTVEESLELIECLQKQGIDHICLTPHFYTHEQSVEDFLASRNAAFKEFFPHIPSGVGIVLGAEVYVTDYLFNSDNWRGISYGKSPYILTEFPYDSPFSERTMFQIDRIIGNHRLIPVLPHVERYEKLMDNPRKIEELRDIGMLIQTNISNYTAKAPFFRKRKLLKMIARGQIDLLGSDAHSFKHNTPEVFTEAMHTISEKCGDEVLADMMRNAEQLFREAVKGQE